MCPLVSCSGIHVILCFLNSLKAMDVNLCMFGVCIKGWNEGVD